MNSLLQDIPTNFSVKVQIDDNDIYRIATGVYIGILLFFVLKKGKR